MIKETTWRETDCLITGPAGQQYESGGAAISEDYLVGYMAGKGKELVGLSYNVTDWHGNLIGSIRVTGRWPIRGGWTSDCMISGRVTLTDGSGREYNVRGCGFGMLLRGKRSGNTTWKEGKQMKTTTQVIKEGYITARLVRAVIKQLGGKESLQDIYRHGVDGGFHGFIYYTDTVAFFKRNREEIVELVKQTASDLGEEPTAMVASFRCLDPADKSNEKMSEIARALYGGRLGSDDFLVANALAWFAAEEVARAFCDY